MEEEKIKRQIGYLKEYIESLIDIYNSILSKKYPYKMSKPSDAFWGELEKLSMLFLEVIWLASKEDLVANRSDVHFLLQKYWDLEIYIPDGCKFFPELVSKYIQQTTIEIEVTPPVWLSFITFEYEPDKWKLKIQIDGGNITLLLVRDKKMIIADIFDRGAIHIGPFALALYLISDNDWEKIIQVVNNARTT
ncbi:MAG: hypothetical protein JHC26_01935 [Thermofilum sp.]|jgi:hypothetical protein|uniref:hypothetical protein n=1 Tax=Thermofilum sp. TaxID=1961369 RepID=UPI00258B23A7|nr:hypothetical protein [Thermofilum sp.]MCI4407823.1 hypothetical protein [Thermofilum sp.]